jgi:hypothetical protein
MLTQIQPPICILCHHQIDTPCRIIQKGCPCNPSYHTNCIIRWNDWLPDRCPSCENPVEFQYETNETTYCKRQLIAIYTLFFIIVLSSVLIWYFTVLQ